MRAAHRTIGLGQGVQEPFHFRLFERRVHLDRRVARGGRRDFRLQCFNRNRRVFALDAIENFGEQFVSIGRANPGGHGLDRHAFRTHGLDFKSVREQFFRDLF